VAFRFAGELPLTGYVRSAKGSRGGRLGRESEMGEEVYGGGYGMGNYVNIENNPIQTVTGAVANTGTMGNIGGVGATTGGETTTPEPTTPTEPTLTPRASYVPHKVTYQEDPFANLTSQEAVGKANQLLARAIGDVQVKDQTTYNKLFEPLYQDLQTGNDYGKDIERFYTAARGAGFEPYATTGTDIKKGADNVADYSAFVNQKFGEAFYDPADFGRRIIEAKAFYRPGGEATNLTAIGQVANEIAGGRGQFYGKQTPEYGGGYRAASFVNKSDPFRAYYESYLKGM